MKTIKKLGKNCPPKKTEHCIESAFENKKYT
jgi:hypothetical protein